MPRASVIIPICNVEKNLVERPDSVLGQTLEDVEVVCVDDGSTDRSPSVLAEMSVSAWSCVRESLSARGVSSKFEAAFAHGVCGRCAFAGHWA